jgi:hypothetical protein
LDGRDRRPEERDPGGDRAAADDQLLRVDADAPVRARPDPNRTGRAAAAVRPHGGRRRVLPRDPVTPAAQVLLDGRLGGPGRGSHLGRQHQCEREGRERASESATCGGTDALIASFVLGDARILAGDARAGYPLLREARPLVDSEEVSLFGYIGAMIARTAGSSTTRRAAGCSPRSSRAPGPRAR